MDSTKSGQVHIVAKHDYNFATLTYVNSFIKTYAKADGTQAHLLGKAGNTSGTVCADGTAQTDCATPLTFSFTNAVHDAVGQRWFMGSRGGTRIISVPESGTGTVSTLTTASVGILSLAYQASTNKLFYCAGGVLRSKDLTTSVETSLAWPISSLSCSGYNLIYSASRNSLIFPFEQNNLYGVAEYSLAP